MSLTAPINISQKSLVVFIQNNRDAYIARKESVKKKRDKLIKKEFDDFLLRLDNGEINPTNFELLNQFKTKYATSISGFNHKYKLNKVFDEFILKYTVNSPNNGGYVELDHQAFELLVAGKYSEPYFDMIEQDYKIIFGDDDGN